jgi:uncharacterized membrane protein
VVDNYQQIRWIRFLPCLFVVIGMPLALQLVPPNDLYGIRIPSTLASDGSWYRANFWAGIFAIAFGLMAMLVTFAVDRSTSVRPSAKSKIVLAATVSVAVLMILAGVAAA